MEARRGIDAALAKLTKNAQEERDLTFDHGIFPSAIDPLLDRYQ
jgi:hypothetical protein